MTNTPVCRWETANGTGPDAAGFSSLSTNLPSMAREVLHNVQALRFVAAGAILVSHTADLLIPHDSRIWSVQWTAGVDIFFVISGFIMFHLTRGRFGEAGAATAFLARRIIRIVPPYWLFTTLMLASALAFDAYVRNATVAPAPILTSYFFVPWPRADGQLNPLLSLGWTLNYEMFFYISFSLALVFRRGLLMLAAAFALLACAHPWIPEKLFVLHFWSEPIILEFLLGIGLGALWARGLRLPRWAAAALVVAGMLVRFPLHLGSYGEFGRLVLSGIPAVLICAGLMLLPDPARPGLLARALRMGGDASYALYLSHPFTVNAVVLLWLRFGPDLPWLGLAFAMAAAIAAALLFYRMIERPMTDYLQRRAGTAPLRGAAAVAP